MTPEHPNGANAMKTPPQPHPTAKNVGAPFMTPEHPNGATPPNLTPTIRHRERGRAS